MGAGEICHLQPLKSPRGGRGEMILETEKGLQPIAQVAVETALGCWGFPVPALLLVSLMVPGEPFYRTAACLRGVVLKIRGGRTVTWAMRNLSKTPVQIAKSGACARSGLTCGLPRHIVE